MYKVLNVSQLSEMTGIDRRTVKKYLDGLDPISNKRNEKTYFAPLVIPILLHKKNGNVDWPFIITELLNSKTINFKEIK